MADEAPKMQATLGLTGLTMNAMALIAPGAFLWLTFYIQATTGVTAPAMWLGIVLALLLCQSLGPQTSGQLPHHQGNHEVHRKHHLIVEPCNMKRVAWRGKQKVPSQRRKTCSNQDRTSAYKERQKDDRQEIHQRDRLVPDPVLQPKVQQ